MWGSPLISDRILVLATAVIVGFAASTDALRSQARRYEIHRRGMLHQTVYNTGELGRPYDDGNTGSTPNIPSFEWPARSAMFVDGTPYNGQYNSFGAGFYIFATKNLDSANRYTDMCGAVSDNDGNAGVVEGVFSEPISITRMENYPVLADGRLNPMYDPDEAEEVIVSKWRALQTNVIVTRTSRAWSYPDYDDFIIYEYVLENSSSDTLTDMIVAWGYSLAASLFGNERKFNRWSEADFRARDQFARYDLTRYLSYNHDRTGSPDDRYFSVWAQSGRFGGGLNSPQAVGIFPLHYDRAHLALRGQTNAFVARSDFRYVWDTELKMKQPYINRYENGNLYPSKIGNYGFLDCVSQRKTSPVSGIGNDPVNFPAYWIGRSKPSWTIGSRQPVGHIYGFGPYTLRPGQKMTIVLAEVAGFGAGTAEDSVFKDIGGGAGSDGNDPDPGMHPVPSHYAEIQYPEAVTPNGPSPVMGSKYLSMYPLPAYVNSNVITIRDVADRAIQMYTGGVLVKHDTTQFKPENTPSTGVLQAPIPFPAPAIRVENTLSSRNKIMWKSYAESFTATRLRAPLSHYEVIRADHPLDRWKVIDSVGIQDPRFYTSQDSTYMVSDNSSALLEAYYYAVVTVDALGGRSGMTNMTLHETQLPAAPTMDKVYVVPNPLIVSSGFTGASPSGDINDRIGFFGLPKRATIRIYSYSGQLINTIEHDVDNYTAAWYQVTRNSQLLASGVYFFIVDDDLGNRRHGKFVVIH